MKLHEFLNVLQDEIKPHIDHNTLLNEIFIQMGELYSMESGPERDMQILRLAMIAELDASNLYEQMAEIAEDDNVRKVLLDISKEEKVHAGEFEFMLEHIDPEYEEAEEEGEEEVMDLTGLEDEEEED
jgi:rubrerythrin